MNAHTAHQRQARRNGAFDEFNKLHWFWKLMLISGTFGVLRAAIARGKGQPDYEYVPLNVPTPTPYPPDPSGGDNGYE